jgi:hypothetical protein
VRVKDALGYVAASPTIAVQAAVQVVTLAVRTLKSIVLDRGHDRNQCRSR